MITVTIRNAGSHESKGQSLENPHRKFCAFMALRGSPEQKGQNAKQAGRGAAAEVRCVMAQGFFALEILTYGFR